MRPQQWPAAGWAGWAEWIIDRPTKRRQGQTALSIVCRAMFGGEESFLPGQRFDVLFVVAGRESQSLPSYLNETFTFVG